MRALILAVVSTPSQATEDKASLEVQLTDCRAACAAQADWHIVEELVIPGQSRNYAHLDQIVRASPEFAHLVTMIESGAIDLLVCWMWSRVARTMQLTMELGARCDEHAVQIYPVKTPTRIVSPEEFQRTDKTDDQFMRGVHGYQSQKENVYRVERTGGAMRKRIERGLSNAPISRFGYQRAGAGEPLIIAPDEARVVGWMFERRAERMGMAAIANAMNDKGWRTRNGASWDERTVWRMLRSEVYVGIVSWGTARATGRHEPIISQELWDQVQIVNTEQQTPVRARHINPLSGLARCGYCGYAMSYGVRENKRKLPYRFMRCSNYVRSFGRDCVPNQRMASRTEEIVLNRVTELLRNPEIYQRAIASQHDSHDGERLEELDRDLAECRRQQDRLLSVFVTGDVARDQFEAHNARLQLRIASLEAEYRRLSSWRIAAAATSRQLLALAPLAGELPELPYEDLNTVYRQVIQRVEVRHREVEVVLRGA